jgi:hypothetical protein
MKFLAVVLSSSMLVACGGGGSDAPASPTPGSSTPGSSTPGSSTPGSSPPGSSTPGSPTSGSSASGSSPPAVSPASPQLAKYEGAWQENCVDHLRFTKTFTATGSTTFSVATKEEYFDYADCTGAVVATGSYGVPDENVQYAPAVAASVTLPAGENITDYVNPATSVYAVATFGITGSGVKFPQFVGTTMYARVEYTGGYVIVERPGLNGQTTQGALLLRNDELLALVPIVGFTNSFKVNHRYIR